MPNRIIKESINESRGLSEISFFAEDLYKRLITYADDHGRFNADYQIMRARLYPREIQIVSESDIEDALIELAGIGKISFYTSSTRKEVYGCFPNWSDHQRIRDSKNKCPKPDDTFVNDWYMRRFIPISMKRKIIQRDDFKCQVCGKYISSTTDADALIKMGAGLFHIDHIVPVNQGGRSTEENLRLTCPKCNLSRAKTFSAEEILEITKQGLKKDTCGKLRKVAESSSLIQSNPIQSESESKSESEILTGDMRIDDVFKDYIEFRKKIKKPMTDRAIQLAINKLNKLSSNVDEKIEILNQSIMNGWSGLFPLNGTTKKNKISEVDGW